MEISERLDVKAVKKVSGAAWECLRKDFFEIANTLLSVSADSKSELTTIYVKFLPTNGAADVFAVVWIKSSKKIVVGLALPESIESSCFVAAPQGTKYRGLTKYFVVTEDAPIPSELTDWACSAFQNVSS
ncbi:hypothetical protein N9Z53_03020 [Mariniblastus sp.]|nr:hypothetical protein [Mariniblastus sp.]